MNIMTNSQRTGPLWLGACLLLLFLAGAFRTQPGGSGNAPVPPDPELTAAASSVNTSAESSAPTPASPVTDEEPVNILLIGYDEGDGNSRSDTILLCTFQKEKRQLILTSILRDLYVSIPGHGKNRLNAAYAYGGRSLLKQTLEENLDITIDTSLEVDFSGFAEIVDLLGGVEVELRQDEAESINKSTPGQLTEGHQKLSGKQALAYARIRKLDPDGDFSRTARQRRLLEAMLAKIQDAGPLTLLSLLKQAIPLIDADVSSESLLSLATELLPVLRQLRITGQHIPAEGTYSYETIQGMSVLVADLEAAGKLLKGSLE